MSTRITKSKTDKVIDGVCGGLAEYFGIDSVLVRLVFVVLVFLDGFGILLYIILMIIMPQADKVNQPAKDTIQENVQEISERVEGLGQAISKKVEEKRPNHALWLGIFLILLGVFFLADNLRLLRWVDKDLLWPIIIILVGVWLLIKRWS